MRAATGTAASNAAVSFGEWLQADMHTAPPKAAPGGFRPMQAALEQLLYDYEVDAMFTGHVHSYERDYPVYQGQLESTSYVDPRATVHLLVGGAGNDEQRDSKRRSRIRRALRGGSSSEDEEVEEEACIPVDSIMFRLNIRTQCHQCSIKMFLMDTFSRTLYIKGPAVTSMRRHITTILITRRSNTHLRSNNLQTALFIKISQQSRHYHNQ